MIPKIIHYCWFGNNELSEMAIHCIESWKFFFPDYEIKEWNEHNFDLQSCDYVKEAVKCKKWAYVSDYARFKILYEHGGIYFDTDVEVIKDMSNILTNGAYLGSETDAPCSVATGLGFACELGNDFLSEVIESYESDHFTDEKGNPVYYTVVSRISKLLEVESIHNIEKKVIEKRGFNIYPSDYFCPVNYNTGVKKVTENTYTIHWYDASWLPKEYVERKRKAQLIRNKYGKYLGRMLAFLYMKIKGVLYRIKKVSK